MSSTNYMMVTVAACDASYRDQALEHIAALVGELKTTAGASTARYGVIATGDHTGHLVLFQGYGELNGIDRAFQVYAASSDYQTMMNSGKSGAC